MHNLNFGNVYTINNITFLHFLSNTIFVIFQIVIIYCIVYFRLRIVYFRFITFMLHYASGIKLYFILKVANSKTGCFAYFSTARFIIIIRRRRVKLIAVILLEMILVNNLFHYISEWAMTEAVGPQIGF